MAPKAKPGWRLTSVLLQGVSVSMFSPVTPQCVCTCGARAPAVPDLV